MVEKINLFAGLSDAQKMRFAEKLHDMMKEQEQKRTDAEASASAAVSGGAGSVKKNALEK